MSDCDLDNWDPMADDYQTERGTTCSSNGVQQDVLFIRNIAKEWEQETVRLHFSRFGKVTGFHFLPKKWNSTTRCAIIHFSSPREANLALASLNGVKPMNYVISFARNSDKQPDKKTL
ncbi:uncharacterized protein LOC136028810 [Artemia franciscana]|uniref:uncharacterized protein LOC136028810 n=1 Tax=Artemia franciscana TaxID=6661 RepID=UPI0032DAF48A